jgi:trehalose 2-sulfotransferase
MPAPALAYLVCATHRSGSNLLCQMLWHTGLAGFPQEAFSPTRRAIIAGQHGLTTDPEKDFAGYIRELMAIRQTPNGIFGAKMMWKHLPGFCEAFGGDPARPWITLRAELPSLRCLWVRRRDVARQAISLVKAKQSKIYNTLQLQEGREPETSEIRYDFAAIDKEVRRFRKEDEAWAGFFRDSGITPAEITYEDFARDFDGHIRRVLAHLEVVLPADFRCPTTNYTRQSDATNDEWANRYEADRAR